MHQENQKDPDVLTKHVKLEQNVSRFMFSYTELCIRNEADFGRALVILKRFHKDWPRYKRGKFLTYDSVVWDPRSRLLKTFSKTLFKHGSLNDHAVAVHFKTSLWFSPRPCKNKHLITGRRVWTKPPYSYGACSSTGSCIWDTWLERKLSPDLTGLSI